MHWPRPYSASIPGHVHRPCRPGHQRVLGVVACPVAVDHSSACTGRCSLRREVRIHSLRHLRQRQEHGVHGAQPGAGLTGRQAPAERGQVKVGHGLPPDGLPTRAAPHAVLDVLVGKPAVGARRAASIPAARRALAHRGPGHDRPQGPGC
eukprot:8070266-Lingulodinium_polyedra.AAC.1